MKSLHDIAKRKDRRAAFWIHQMVNTGADVNARDRRGYTPLDVALGSANWAAVAVLKKLGGKTSRGGILRRILPLR